jgi:protein TonB
VKEAPATPIEPSPDNGAVATNAPSKAEPSKTNTATAKSPSAETPATNSAATDTSNTAQPAGTDSAVAASASNDAEEVKTISTGSLNARATKRVTPTYPAAAKSSGVEGVVRVYVTLDESGKVAEVTNSEGPVPLRQSAEEAVRGWRFPPTAVDGKAVRLTGYVEFSFTR